MAKVGMPLLVIGLLGLVVGCARAPGVAQPEAAASPAAPSAGGTGMNTQTVAGIAFTLPAGFGVNLFAQNLGRARFMAVDPQGRLMVCDPEGDRVLTLPDANGDGQADRNGVFARDLPEAHSLAWHEGRAYVAGDGRVTRLEDSDGDGVADRRQVLVNSLPIGGQHSTRTIVFGPEGKMYVSVGSSGNLEIGGRLRAAVLRFNADGTGMEVFATGLRNSVGLAVDPATGQLWGTDNARDMLGDDIPPDELNIIREGFYGYPYYYGDNVRDPAFTSRPAPGIPPALKFQAHSAPLGLCFYTGDQFPAEYRGQVFVCFHGSWNRTVPTGYKVVLVTVRDNRPVSYRDFMAGFRTPSGEVPGRPVDPVVGRDGALYISDDKGGKVWRVSWQGGSANPGRAPARPSR